MDALEIQARLRLNSVPGVHSAVWAAWLEKFVTARAVLEQSPEDLARESGRLVLDARRILEGAAKFDAERELRRMERLGVRACCCGDSSYPSLLAQIPDPPLVLYAWGGELRSEKTLAFVGTRRPSAYGRRMARALSRQAADRGWVSVSGMARGIDTEAHEAALEARGTTWAVLGSGLEKIYPPENLPLARRIVESGGTVLSEYPLQSPPWPENFPKRNRIISGLSQAVIVVEGGEKSGSLITARLALEQGREVFAVPGPADSEGSRAPHLLIKQGARPAESLSDVWETLSPEEKSIEAPPPSLERAQAEVLNQLGTDGVNAEDLALQLGWQTPRLSRILVEMEMKGLLIRLGGNRYARR